MPEYDTTHAVAFGIQEAVAIGLLVECMRVSGEVRDERYWIRMSIADLRPLFPFWSDRQTARVLDSLVKKGVLIRRAPVQGDWGRAYAYAFEAQGRFLPSPEPEASNQTISPNGEMHFTKPSNAFDETGKWPACPNKESPSGTVRDPDPSPSETLTLSGELQAQARGKRAKSNDFTTAQALAICVDRTCKAWSEATREADPNYRPTVGPNDRQAVRNAAKALKDSGVPDWKAAEDELVPCVRQLAQEGRPLSALSWKLNELRNPGSARPRQQSASKSPTVESLEEAHRRNMIALGVEDGTE